MMWVQSGCGVSGFPIRHQGAAAIVRVAAIELYKYTYRAL